MVKAVQEVLGGQVSGLVFAQTSRGEGRDMHCVGLTVELIWTAAEMLTETETALLGLGGPAEPTAPARPPGSRPIIVTEEA